MTTIPLTWPAFRWGVVRDWTLSDSNGQIIKQAAHAHDAMLTASTILDGKLVWANDTFDVRRLEGIGEAGFDLACSLMACDLLHQEIDK